MRTRRDRMSRAFRSAINPFLGFGLISGRPHAITPSHTVIAYLSRKPVASPRRPVFDSRRRHDAMRAAGNRSKVARSRERPTMPDAPSDRSILITGASSGIGYAAAEILAARGWRVFATARRDVDLAALAARSEEHTSELQSH